MKKPKEGNPELPLLPVVPENPPVPEFIPGPIEEPNPSPPEFEPSIHPEIVTIQRAFSFEPSL